MNLNLQQFHNLLNNQSSIPKAWLFFGYDVGGVDLAYKKLMKTIESFQSILVSRYDYSEIKSDVSLLSHNLFATNLLGEINVVIINKCGEEISKDIQDIILKLCDHNCISYLIMLSEDLRKGSKIRDFFSKSAKCAALNCYKQDPQTLIAYSKFYLNKLKVNYDDNALQIMINYVKNDKRILLNELNKIYFYSLNDTKRITVDAVIELLDYDGEISLNDLCMKSFCGDIGILVQNITQHSISPMLVLRTLQNYALNIIKIHNLKITQPQFSILQIIDELKLPIFGIYKEQLVNNIKKISKNQANEILITLIKLEKKIKETSVNNITLLQYELMNTFADINKFAA